MRRRAAPLAPGRVLALVLAPVLALIAVEGGACLPALERSNGLGSGAVIFDVVDQTGAPQPGAVVRVDGAVAMATADPSGHVALRRLLPGDVVVRVDVRDDEGVVVAGAVLDDAGVAVAPIVRNAFVGGEEGLTSQLHTDVVVHPVAALSGVVDAAACGPGTCRVVVARRIDLGTTFKRPVLGAVEATTAVDDSGAWSVARIVPGDLVVALLHAPLATTPGPVAAAVAASRPDAFAVVDAAVAVGVPHLDVTLPALQPLPATTDVDLELSGNVGDAARAAGLVELFAPSTRVDAVDAVVDFADLVDATPVVAPLSTPTGLFDVSVLLDDGVFGLVRGALLLPGLPPPAPVVLGGLDVCDVVADGHDCDGDGVKNDDDDDGDGIPDEDEPRPCNADDPARDCDGDGRAANVDGDDDGDGQPDVEETTPCLGPGRGTDDDGDCLCEPFDPLPACASNDPAACAVDTPVLCPT